MHLASHSPSLSPRFLSSETGPLIPVLVIGQGDWVDRNETVKEGALGQKKAKDPHPSIIPTVGTQQPPLSRHVLSWAPHRAALRFNHWQVRARIHQMGIRITQPCPRPLSLLQRKASVTLPASPCPPFPTPNTPIRVLLSAPRPQSRGPTGPPEALPPPVWAKAGLPPLIFVTKRPPGTFSPHLMLRCKGQWG